MALFRCSFAGCNRVFNHVRGLETHRSTHYRGRPPTGSLLTSSAAERHHLHFLAQQRARQEYVDRLRRRQSRLRNHGIDPDSSDSSGSDSEDDSSTDSSADSDDDRAHDDRPEWEYRQKRKIRVDRHPLAGWARRADGELCDEHTPPPTVYHAHLFDENNVFYPFRDEKDYRGAYLFGPLSESQFNALVGYNKEWLRADHAFNNRLQLRSIIEKIPYARHTEWREVEIAVSAEELGWSGRDAELPFLKEEHTFRFRDLHEVFKHLLSNPMFCGHQHLQPIKITEMPSNGQERRVYGAPHTADKAWEVQATLDHPTDVAVRVDTSSDSTVLSIGTGTASAHPMYFSLGNNAGFLKRENHGGMVVVAFLPKVERTDKGYEEMFRIYKRRVLHRALEILWEPVKHLLTGRHLFQFADGHYRYIRLYLGPVSVDYPEACWLTSIVQGYVPWWVKKHLVGITSKLRLPGLKLPTLASCVQEPLKLQEGPAAPRTSAGASEVRREASQRRTVAAQMKAAKQAGYHLGKTVWDYLQVNGHELMVADPLHQLIKGMGKDITIDDLFIESCAQLAAECRRNKQKLDELLGRIELHLRLMPLHSQLRRFKDGFQHSNWTGKHTRDLMKIFPAAVWDVQIIGDDYEPITVVDENAQVMSLISLLIMYATSFEATSDDVDHMEFAYDAYMFLVRNTYDRFRNIDGQIEKLDFNWPRLHAVSHYAEWTKKWGVSVHSDTNISERAHIDTVKVAYRASNKCNTASQIIRYSRRADKLRSLRNVVDLDSHVKSTGNRVIFSTPEPLPHTFYLPRRPSGNNRRLISMRALEVALRQPGLLKLTAAYFLAIGLLREQVETLGDFHGKWFLSFKVSNRIYQDKSENLKTRDDMGIITHVIRATPRYKHGNDSGYSARYDCVFVHNYAPMGKYHKHTTFKDRAWHFLLPFTILRLRGIFSVVVDGTCHQLCIGDEFEWCPNSDQNLAVLQPVLRKRMDNDGQSVKRIFRIEDVLRPAFVQPLFGHSELDPDLDFQNVLDNWHGEFVVNLTQDQHIFRHVGRHFGINILREHLQGTLRPAVQRPPVMNA